MDRLLGLGRLRHHVGEHHVGLYRARRSRASFLLTFAVLALALFAVACNSDAKADAGEVEPVETDTPAATATEGGGETATPASGSSGRPPRSGTIVAGREYDLDGTPSPTATATATREPTPPPEPVWTNIESFVRDFGLPGDAGFARIQIPVLGVDTGVGTRAVGANGRMPNPAGPADVVWYDFSGSWPGFGGYPGAGNNAVFSGHVDYADRVPYANGALYRGRGVFYGLNLLSPGDVIRVAIDGQQLTYTVQWVQEIPASGGDWGSILSADTGVDSITLITCGGDFDFNSRQYASRTVVRAVRS